MPAPVAAHAAEMTARRGPGPWSGAPSRPVPGTRCGRPTPERCFRSGKRAVRLYPAGRCTPRPGVLPGLGAAVGVAPAGRGDAARGDLARLVRRSLWRPGLPAGDVRLRTGAAPGPARHVRVRLPRARRTHQARAPAAVDRGRGTRCTPASAATPSTEASHRPYGTSEPTPTRPATSTPCLPAKTRHRAHHPRAGAQLLEQGLPLDAGVRHEQHPAQGLPVRYPRPALHQLRPDSGSNGTPAGSVAEKSTPVAGTGRRVTVLFSGRRATCGDRFGPPRPFRPR